jgi:hypothetical protein
VALWLRSSNALGNFPGLDEFDKMDDIPTDSTSKALPQLLFQINVERLSRYTCMVGAVTKKQVEAFLGNPVGDEFLSNLANIGCGYKIFVVIAPGVRTLIIFSSLD